MIMNHDDSKTRYESSEALAPARGQAESERGGGERNGRADERSAGRGLNGDFQM